MLACGYLDSVLACVFFIHTVVGGEETQCIQGVRISWNPKFLLTRMRNTTATAKNIKTSVMQQQQHSYTAGKSNSCAQKQHATARDH